MGGTDVDPARYGEPRAPKTQPADEERDSFELEVLARALQSELPVLAICRGMQLLNVYAGGTLHQHLASERHDPPNEAETLHDVDIEGGTLLANVIAARRCAVNSYHHQAAARIGTNLRVSARDAADATVEALEHTQYPFVLGVQWHPEDRFSKSPHDFKLFEQFARSVHTS